MRHTHTKMLHSINVAELLENSQPKCASWFSGKTQICRKFSSRQFNRELLVCFLSTEERMFAFFFHRLEFDTQLPRQCRRRKMKRGSVP